MFLTPKQYAARLGVQVDAVLRYIHAGELVAINTARPGAIKPAWRISAEAIEQFERRRSTAVPPDGPPRRKRPAIGAPKEYFA